MGGSVFVHQKNISVFTAFNKSVNYFSWIGLSLALCVFVCVPPLYYNKRKIFIYAHFNSIILPPKKKVSLALKVKCVDV